MVIAFFWLLDQPVVAWFFVASLFFNVIVLIPLWIVSWLAANYQPELWSVAAAHVYVFSLAFVVPTGLFYWMWKRVEE